MEAEASHAPHDHAATVRAAAAAERVVFLTLIVGAAAISIGINLWKRWHLRSFQLVSLVALWLLPAINGVYSGWSRFLVAWTAYTAATAYILWTASRKPLARETPKRVYRYLSLMYTCCSYACVGAYVIFTAMLIFAPQGNRHRQPRRHLHISPPEHEGEQPRISIHNGAVHVEGGDDSLAPMPPPPPPPVPGETLPSVVVDYLFSGARLPRPRSPSDCIRAVQCQALPHRHPFPSTATPMIRAFGCCCCCRSPSRCCCCHRAACPLQRCSTASSSPS